jgi:hypothetical protein
MSGLAISAVVPVFDGMAFLPRSLPPLLAMLRRGELCEVIVVDDGSTDGSGEWARAQGARVLATGGRFGPGCGRNLAAQEARGDVLWFVDADVVAHADAATPLRAALADPGVVAVFGSYDDAPPDPGFASQYMNLRHHFVHQRDAGEASTFWAGCGAVRRADFLAVGGFDAERYTRPSIEDIELGYRLRGRGRIVIEPRMQGTHLKRWTLASVIHTDVVCRALPWSRLLLSQPGAPLALNAGPSEQLRAALAGALVLALLLALVGAAPAWAPLAAWLATLAANRDLFAFFRRARGTGFALAALLFHQLYYLYSAGVFALCWLERRAPRGSTA